MIDIQKIRRDFPILVRTVNGKQLVYFDNAATSQKPRQVIDSLVDFYSNHNANIHRGVHTLSQEATDLFENARKKVQLHFNAKKSHEIIFTSGTTHSINLVASGFAAFLKRGMRLSYQHWSTTAILFPGKCYASVQGQCCGLFQ